MLDDAVRLVAGLDEDRRAATSSGPTRWPTWPSTATGGGPPRASSARRRDPTGPGLLPLLESRSWRDDADLAEVYAAWGGHAYGRELDGRAPARTWSPPTGGSGRGQEHRQPRARHRRLRRLLPVPRRHGGHGPGADRQRPARLHRRQHPARSRPDPVAGRGDRPACSGPGWSTRAGSRPCAGTATRARSSWPPRSTTSSAGTPPPAWWPTGCTSSSPPSYVLDPETRRVPRGQQPVGAARHHRAAARSGRPRPVGRPGAGHPGRPARDLPPGRRRV